MNFLRYQRLFHALITENMFICQRLLAKKLEYTIV